MHEPQSLPSHGMSSQSRRPKRTAYSRNTEGCVSHISRLCDTKEAQTPLGKRCYKLLVRVICAGTIESSAHKAVNVTYSLSTLTCSCSVHDGKHTEMHCRTFLRLRLSVYKGRTVEHPTSRYRNASRTCTACRPPGCFSRSSSAGRRTNGIIV